MATSFGTDNNKTNYVSSSDSEDDNEPLPPSLPPPVHDGLPQTGPKGVLMDYHRHLEEQKLLRMEEKERRMEIIHQSAPTVKPRSEDQIDKGTEVIIALNSMQEGDDPFMEQYRARRLQELKEQAKAPGVKRKIYGNLTEVRGDKFASAIDSAPPGTYVVIHIYDDFFEACCTLNRALTKLAKTYPTVKFCRVRAEHLPLSKGFQDKGLPALLVYKDGDLIGNNLNVTDSVGTDFTETDIEEFLLQQRCLPSDAEAKIMSPYNLSPRHTPTKQLSDDDDD